MKINGFYKFNLPFVSLSIESRKVDFVIDTGFNGQLMLPESIVKELSLNEVGEAEYFTADGDVSITQTYLANIDWIGSKKPVFLISTPLNFALIGMGLLRECRIVLQPQKNILELEQ